MFNWLRSRSLSGRTASALYGSIVAQARDPAFYGADAIPDSMEGRFSMIVVHMHLALERVRAQGGAGQALGQSLLEAFMTDMDDSMREIGIGDMAVPRRVKKAAVSLKEQLEVYRMAMAANGDEALKAALVRNAAITPDGATATRLATYMRRATADLDGQPWSRIARGEITFPAFGA